jgi:hypothetical protein
MDRYDYYTDQKYCPSCDKYVAYLMSIERSFCVECGGEVRLFSKEDWESFNESLSAKRPRGGRPRKSGRQSGRESA